MANHGPKFASVNLNKSYGQQHQHSQHTHFPHFGGGGSSYGQATAAGRNRGGMVLLSRNRGGPSKVVSKLSVPPPLNLPSLRKEHEKFDLSGPGGVGSNAGTGNGARPTSAGVGWTKPAAAERKETGDGATGIDVVDGATQAVGSYMPPTARSTGVLGAVASAPRTSLPSAEKTTVLRGEDFPSLQAARPLSAGVSQKQKDGLTQKPKQAVGEELIQDKKAGYHVDHLGDVNISSRNLGGHGSGGYVSKGHTIGSGQMAEQIQKREDKFPDPLALVNLNPRSDWADDERDTGHGLMERGRYVGFSSPESYWDKDFYLPRPNLLPHKPAQNQYDRHGQRDNETGKNFSSEVPKSDLHNKDVRALSQESNKWRASTFSRDGFGSQETGNRRVDLGAKMVGYNNLVKEKKYIPSHSGDGSVVLNQDSVFGRRNVGLVGQQEPQRNLSVELFNNKGHEHWGRPVTEQPNSYRSDDFQNNRISKSYGGKLPPIADPIQTIGRNKQFSKSERSFSDSHFSSDFGSTDFDEKDIFSVGLVGVVKRKKDAARPTEFHDPVRESFEAELERVQKMQELERQRIVEEQEKAFELARREEEERLTKIKEEEKVRQRYEEDAREAARKAELEQLETIRRAEEQRIVREEEKRRIQLEEERRKEGAKQKLLELEAKMARREAKAAKGDASVSKNYVDEKLEVAIKEKHASTNLDLDEWEDSERVVENTATLGLFDSSSHRRPIDLSLRPYPPKDGPSKFMDKEKALNYRRDLSENGGSFPPPLSGQEIGHYSPRRDAVGGGRAALRKDFHGGSVSSRSYYNTGMQESYSDELAYHKGNRWNFPGNIDPYGKIRETGSEFPDNISDKYGDVGWGQRQSRDNNNPPYIEQLYPNSEANEFYSYGRSRFSLRQPRVLPPPVSPVQKNDYYGSNQEGLESSEIFGLQQENTPAEQNLKSTARCDSQSSLSVSSPPSSAPHLSQDELDESGDYPVTSAVAEGKRNFLTGSGSSVLDDNSGNDTIAMAPDSVSAIEDEEWTLENENRMQQQEEYDEDEDSYREEGEAREGEQENFELNQKFQALELDESEPPHMVENVVLGFDEGIQVVIPSDDFEKNTGAQEKLYGIPISSAGNMEESGPVGVFPSDEQSTLPMDDCHGTSIVGSSRNVPEKSVWQGSNVQAVNASYSLATADLFDGADYISSTGLTVQGSVSSSAAAADVSNHINMPSLSSGSHGLNFGLFSGPSLIPSPVPFIQIGSIQMPLHIHPPIGHLHSSKSPMFQFGQFQYTSHFSQIAGGPVTRDTCVQNVAKDEVPSLSTNKIPCLVSLPEQCDGSLLQGHNNVVDADSSHEGNIVARSSSIGASGASDKNMKSESLYQAKEKAHHHTDGSYLLPRKPRPSEFQSQHLEPMMQSAAGEKRLSGPKSVGPSSGRRGRRYTYTVKNTNTRLPIQEYGVPTDLSRSQRKPQRTVQRTEFRIRGNNDRNASYVLVSSNNADSVDKSDYTGKVAGGFSRSGSNRGIISNRSIKQRVESEDTRFRNEVSRVVNSGDKKGKELERDLPREKHNTSRPGEEIHFRTAFEEDVDAPLQSGVVRVFKQPGIEAPSDEDDFIEVRSKRQMLNDRREQREKEIKEKSRNTKPQLKLGSNRQKDFITKGHNKVSVPSSIQESNSQADFAASGSPHLHIDEVPTRLLPTVSQPKIRSPAMNSETQSIKPNQEESLSVVSNEKAECERGTILDEKNKVMSLSQTQIDEAMKPIRYDSSSSAAGGHSVTFSDPIMSTPSILTKDKSSSSSVSQIDSLLAGEKIQFGALTTPTVLPRRHGASHSIGAPGSKRPDMQLSQNFSVPAKDNSLFLGKEKLPSDTHVSLQDCEAKAEAAASAVSGSTISSSELGGNGLGSVGNTKIFVGADSDGIAPGVPGNKLMTNQLQGEELLNVSLPADLSVEETTSTSFLPPLTSPQSSSSQIISHFPGGSTSHFPFYEMNPMLGGPIFAFSPQEESSRTQSQPQQSAASSSGHPNSWHPCHSGMDSFYGPPAGYSGPFIGAPGGIPGVQGPPHMVVYNHFAPVGQYGQVGLSFMGAAYVPPGKQSDWKNPPTSSAMSVGEGEINNIMITNVQRTTSKTAPIQHLAPGSPLLPIPSPLPMFDVSQFQTSPDMAMQACWGHASASPLHPVPVSRPLQPQGKGGLSSQVNHENSIEQSLTANRFTESQAPAPSVDAPNITSSAADKTNAPFPSGRQLAAASITAAESVKFDNSKHQNESSEKNHLSQKNASSTAGHGYQRGRVSQRTNTRNEWSHRRMGFRGRNHSSSGGDKGFPATKVKQIYVAKKTSMGNSSTSPL